jgi:transposase
MDQYVGLDVSQAETSVCVIDSTGNRVWQGRCVSTPQAIAKLIADKAPAAVKVGLETGPLAVWHWHALRALKVPVVCLHAREAKAALSLQSQKTDRNDAHGLAQIVRAGWYREVIVRSLESHELRLTLIAHRRLVSMRTCLYNQIRGVLKTFGVVLAPGKGGTFERHLAKTILPPTVTHIVEVMRNAWRAISKEIVALRRVLDSTVRHHQVCRRLMTIPGVGTHTALAFVTSVDSPERFRRARDLGPFLGLTPRRYQSGEVDRTGRITKCGDRLTRSLLFEAAGALLTRSKVSCKLREWATAVWRRSGLKKAKVALARKLAVVMLTIWRSGSEFAPVPAPKG